MKKTNYHIYNISFIEPLLQGLNKSGVSMNLITSGAISKFNINTPNTYLPMKVLYEFLLKVKTDQGIDNIAKTFYSRFKINELGDFGEYITQCPDLLTVILEGIKYESVLQTNTRIKLDIQGPISSIYTIHLDPPSEGRQIAEDAAFAMILEAFNMVLGKSWKPISIQINSKSEHGFETLIPKGDIPVQPGCSYHGFTFKTGLLAQRNLGNASNPSPLKLEMDSFSNKVYLILNGSKAGYIPTLNDFSDYFGVSRRTIIRSLESEGTSFSALLQRYLFTSSLKLLRINSLSVKDISQQLGYANTSNFLRAFKNWTNTSLSEFRLKSV